MEALETVALPSCLLHAIVVLLCADRGSLVLQPTHTDVANNTHTHTDMYACVYVITASNSQVIVCCVVTPCNRVVLTRTFRTDTPVSLFRVVG